jgi:hypothetical protein
VVGVLVLRAWLEDGDRTRFRARVMSTYALEGEPEAGVVAASPEAVLELVARWLEGFGTDVTAL